MGSFGSREVTTQTRDLAVPITKLFANFTALGFIIGIMIHQHEFSIYINWVEGPVSISKYLSGLYFFWYSLTWYIVYVGTYYLIIEVILRPILFALVGYRRELQLEILIELLFGMFVCGEIVGSWVDWVREEDCLKTHDCQSNFMQSIMFWMESICEYLSAYEYDAKRDGYFLRENNVCYRVFHAVPTFLMTLLSTSLAYVMIIVYK